MDRRRKAVFLGAAMGIALVALAGTAIAGHIGEDVKSYTGCLTTSGGTLSLVKEGNAPQRACPSGSVLAHLSGGDITEVEAGTGLTGGGDNGSVTLSLDAGHSLPQGCDSFQFPMSNSTGWVCADHEIGTGLGLSKTLAPSGNSVEYEIASNYRVKNSPDCDSGKFATGFEDDGDIVCATPSAALQAFSSPQADYDTGLGIPDDGAFHVMASISLAAGNYFVTGKGLIQSEGNVDQFRATECRIQSGSVVYDSLRFGSNQIDENFQTTVALAGLGHHDGGTIDLACAADDGADGLELENGRLVVIKVG